MTREQAAAMAQAHMSLRAITTRSDVPQPLAVRRAVYAFLREMVRQAEDERRAQEIRHVQP